MWLWVRCTCSLVIFPLCCSCWVSEWKSYLVFFSHWMNVFYILAELFTNSLLICIIYPLELQGSPYGTEEENILGVDKQMNAQLFWEEYINCWCHVCDEFTDYRKQMAILLFWNTDRNIPSLLHPGKQAKWFRAVSCTRLSSHALQVDTWHSAAHTHLMKMQPSRLNSSADHTHTHTYLCQSLLNVLCADKSDPLIWLTYIWRLRMIKCYSPKSLWQFDSASAFSGYT